MSTKGQSRDKENEKGRENVDIVKTSEKTEKEMRREKEKEDRRKQNFELGLEWKVEEMLLELGYYS